VQSAFGTVVVIVCAVGAVGAIAALLGSRRTWDDYSRDHLIRDSESRPAAMSSAAATVERDEEIRQMLEARNARRQRRGESPVDIEHELARLTAPAIDDELRAEIRDMVVARNHRRARRGEPALDVDAEIEREITELGRL